MDFFHQCISSKQKITGNKKKRIKVVFSYLTSTQSLLQILNYLKALKTTKMVRYFGFSMQSSFRMRQQMQKPPKFFYTFYTLHSLRKILYGCHILNTKDLNFPINNQIHLYNNNHIFLLIRIPFLNIYNLQNIYILWRLYKYFCFSIHQTYIFLFFANLTSPLLNLAQSTSPHLITTHSNFPNKKLPPDKIDKFFDLFFYHCKCFLDNSNNNITNLLVLRLNIHRTYNHIKYHHHLYLHIFLQYSLYYYI